MEKRKDIMRKLFKSVGKIPLYKGQNEMYKLAIKSNISYRIE